MMIVAIADLSAETVPVLQFRSSQSESGAVDDYCSRYDPPRDPSDYVGVDTGWDPGDVRLMSWWEVSPSGVLSERLDEIKQYLFGEIKNHRDFKRLEDDLSFEFPQGSGQMFSPKLLSQNNWGNLSSVAMWPIPSLSYPITVTTRDDLIKYEIQDESTLIDMLDAIWTTVKTERASAQASIDAVILAPTVEASKAAAYVYLDS